MGQSFRRLDATVLSGLSELAGHDHPVSIAELAAHVGLDQSPVAGALTSLAASGLVEVTEEGLEQLRLGPKAAAWIGGVSPERRVARALAGIGGRCALKDLPSRASMEQREVGQALRWLAARGWATNAKGQLTLAGGWTDARDEPEIAADERLVERLARETDPLDRSLLERERLPVGPALGLLEKRSGVVQVIERRRRFVSLTTTGAKLVEAGVTVREEANELTTDLLVSGRWREISFRPYDVSLAAGTVRQGKEHPFRRILEATRRAYLHMGFEETVSPFVESAFWDFDALFQPQDHPARDMQDTFYSERPARCNLPGDDLVAAVGRTHEDGGATGSTGWRYSWDRELAGRAVLRTHTTSATIRELARDSRPPRKVFCVGPVFRRETIDYKHLPVFHQVDGIVVDAEASFSSLLTLLSTFYTKMGFERIQFRPAFFPYTEPSVEVFVWMEGRKDWVEMGGAGVFRAEVTEPLGCRVPVLAWGLGLERLAMFRFGLSDIRELYLSRLGWLEQVRLCRS